MFLVKNLTAGDCHDIIEGLRLLQKAKGMTATGEKRMITDDRIDELCQEINFCDDLEAVTGWSVNDVSTLRPSWSPTKCRKELKTVARYLKDAMVQSGWEALEKLLSKK